MAKNIQAIRGMNDCSPTESPLWQWIEGQVRQILSSYGYSEVRMPIVEVRHYLLVQSVKSQMLSQKKCTHSGIMMNN